MCVRAPVRAPALKPTCFVVCSMCAVFSFKSGPIFWPLFGPYLARYFGPIFWPHILTRYFGPICGPVSGPIFWPRMRPYILARYVARYFGPKCGPILRPDIAARYCGPILRVRFKLRGHSPLRPRFKGGALSGSLYLALCFSLFSTSV